LALFACLIVLHISPVISLAQSETRERQAAAEAYDQGTASYLSGDYPKAAEWFETANRLSPAAPALIQAARAHQQAGHLTRAATLALRLTREYANEAAAVQYAKTVLDQLAPRFLRVDVVCQGCSLDVDGTLQETQAFFVEPASMHTVTASFESGERKQQVIGGAGENKTLEFSAPPRAVVPVPNANPLRIAQPLEDRPNRPLSPVVTLVAGGVTVLLLAGSIVSTIDMNAGVKPYKAAVAEYNSCLLAMEDSDSCTGLYRVAKTKLDDGKTKQTRTTILWAATGGAALATAVFALLLTDWSGSGDDKADAKRLQLGFAAGSDGATLLVKGHL
jgi:tetratricopeptide (TPR) repeat protein